VIFLRKKEKLEKGGSENRVTIEESQERIESSVWPYKQKNLPGKCLMKISAANLALKSPEKPRAVWVEGKKHSKTNQSSNTGG